jgi:uncharacterized protein
MFYKSVWRINMLIGSCEIELIIYNANSLKEKRHVIKSIIERLKNRFNISICEIGEHDKWQKSIIGLCTLSNSSKLVNETIDKIIDFMDNDSRIEIIDIVRETL